MIGSDTPSEEWIGIITLGSDFEEQFSNYGRARYRPMPKANALDASEVVGIDAPWIPGPAPVVRANEDRQ
jgi:hypothetical protein